MGIDPRLIFLRGRHVWLKALSEQDIEVSDWVGWFNDEDLCAFNQHHFYPNNFAKQRAHLQASDGPDRLVLGVVDVLQPESICGVVSLNNINLLNRNAEIAAMLDKSKTGANPAVFAEAYSLLLRHAFEQLGLTKVNSGTFRPHVMEAMARMFNFQQEGVQRSQVFKNNRYWDVTLMAVFADGIRYPKLPAPAAKTKSA